MCGIFGMIRTNNSSVNDKRFRKVVRALGIAAQVRGTDATGISFNEQNGKLSIIKRAIPAQNFPFIKNIPANCKAVIGHTRLTTQGDPCYNYNNHPFLGKADRRFSLAHNGTLWNDIYLKKVYNLPKTKIETDSYVAVQMLEHYGKLTMKNVAEVAEELEGSFMLTILEEGTNNVWFVKGDNPIYMLEFPDLGVIVYGSTKDIVEQGISKDKELHKYYLLGYFKPITMIQGDIYKFNYNQNKWEQGRFDTSNLYSYGYYSGWNRSYSYNYPTTCTYTYKSKNTQIAQKHIAQNHKKENSLQQIKFEEFAKDRRWSEIQCYETGERAYARYNVNNDVITVWQEDGVGLQFSNYDTFLDYLLDFEVDGCLVADYYPNAIVWGLQTIKEGI